MKWLLFFIRLAIVAGVYAVFGAITNFLLELWMGPEILMGSQDWRDKLGRPSFNSTMIFFAVSGAVSYGIIRPKLFDEWFSTCVFSSFIGFPIIFIGDALVGLLGLNPAGNSMTLGYAVLWSVLSAIGNVIWIFPPAVTAGAVCREIFIHFPLGSKQEK